MHESRIVSEEGFLGPFTRQLKVNDTQHFTFRPKDDGPFWMSESEQRERREDRKTGKIKTKILSVRELIRAIHRKMPALEIKDLKNKNIQDIKTIATGLGIHLQYDYEETKDKGWVGQPKGLLQVLWERGWIDDKQENVMKYYTITGSKDRYGNIIPNTGLVLLMEQCSDFVNELTFLQEKLKTLNVEVHRSPKCHSELAGEGIEYSWGFAKNYYRRLPLKLKRSKDKFRDSVRSTMSRERLTTEIVRKFARRARGYTCAYYAIAYGIDNGELQGERISPQIIERIVKMFKTHRSAIDFEGKYIVKMEQDAEGSAQVDLPVHV